jgi:hypothetical protein
MYTNLRLSGERTASIAVSAQRCAFMRRINGEKAAIHEKWPIRTQWSAEIVSGAFKNVHGELWKNLWIRTF